LRCACLQKFIGGNQAPRLLHQTDLFTARSVALRLLKSFLYFFVLVVVAAVALSAV
jgi:hypothetical protein